MKSIIIFILGAIVWVVIGGKLWYEYVTTQVSTNMTSIIDTVMTQWAGTGGKALLDQYQWQAQVLVDEQKIAIKAEIERQIKDYLNKKVDDFLN